MINFLVGLGASIGVIIIYSLLKVASDFDDEVEEFYNNLYEGDGLNEEYDYYDNKYKEIIDNHEEV